MPNRSNAATELYRLALHLRDKNIAHSGGGKGPSTLHALQEIFGISHEETMFLSLLAVLARRFEQVKELVAAETRFPKDTKKTIFNALKRMRGFLDAPLVNSHWSDCKTERFREDVLVALQLAGPYLEERAPINVPTPDERREFLEKIDDALLELNKLSDVSAAALVGSLRAVRFIVEKLDFFGVGELSEKLANASFCYAAATHPARNAQASSETASALRKAGLALWTIANILVVAHELPPAIEDEWNQTQNLIEFVIDQTEPMVRLLAPPEKPPVDEEQRPEGVEPERMKEPRPAA